MIIDNGHIGNLYNEIKNRVIENFSVSPESELRAILKGEGIGDGKPSLMFSRIRHLGRGRCSDEIIKTIFMEHLPSNCRAVLAVSDTHDLFRLASVDDRIVSYFPSQPEVAPVSVESELKNEIEELTLRIDTLTAKNRTSSEFTRRNRSRSRL